MTVDDDFNWRLEEACINAWPSELSVLFDGWLIRRSGGAIRRSNSVNPLRGPRGEAKAVVDFAERFYAECGQDATFRVPAIAADLDSALEARGYAVQSPTSTLFADLGGDGMATRDAEVRMSSAPDKRWIAAWSRFAGAGAVDRDIYTAMTRLIRLPARFASIEREGEIVAQAYGALHRGVVVIESVATDPEHRQKGLARRVVGSLLAWGRGEGADVGGLQVLADNEPALALYRSVGFGNFAYGYHYRKKR